MGTIELTPRIHDVDSFIGSTLVVSNYLGEETYVARGGTAWAKVMGNTITVWDEVAGHYTVTLRLSHEERAAIGDAIETARSRHGAEVATLQRAADRLLAIAAEHEAKGEGETYGKPIRSFVAGIAQYVSRPVTATNIAHALRAHGRPFETTPRRHLVEAFNRLADLYNPFSGASQTPTGGHRTPEAMGGSR